MKKRGVIRKIYENNIEEICLLKPTDVQMYLIKKFFENWIYNSYLYIAKLVHSPLTLTYGIFSLERK